MGTELTVLTGASRGLGAALAQQLLQPGAVLLCVSRHVDEALAARAHIAGVRLEQWPRDLAQPAHVAEQVEAWLGQFDPARLARATLINNAGVIPHVGPVQDGAMHELSAALRVGLEAPLLLASAFLRATRTWSAQRRVLNISSGLGRRAMAGSAAYCAVKAGMDHFSRAAALDEARQPNGAKIVSLAPGVIDTDMQVQLRSADPAGFPEQENFINLKTQGQLTTPADAARRVLAYLARPDFGTQPVADVRDP